MAYISFMLFGISTNMSLISAFLVTFSVYNLNLLTDRKEDSLNFPEREKYYVSGNTSIIAIAVVSYIVALLFGAVAHPASIIVLLTPLLFGVVYSMRIRNFRLKDYFIGKNVTVSLSWAMEASLLPAVFHFNKSLVAILFSFIFIKGMVNTVLFDMRDIRGDAAAGVKTIPVKLGLRNTKFLLLAMNTLLVPWVIFAFYNSLFMIYIPVLVFCILYGYFYILYFSRKADIPKTHYGILLDGEWIFLLALFLLTKAL
ncbi:MAG: UbiA family prenyltransferase [Thermoplasmata archaeon]|nr:UbiA family prenyltransferase [Thermoplasmata archaeon]